MDNFLSKKRYFDVTKVKQLYLATNHSISKWVRNPMPYLDKGYVVKRVMAGDIFLIDRRWENPKVLVALPVTRKMLKCKNPVNAHRAGTYFFYGYDAHTNVIGSVRSYAKIEMANSYDTNIKFLGNIKRMSSFDFVKLLAAMETSEIKDDTN